MFEILKIEDGCTVSFFAIIIFSSFLHQSLFVCFYWTNNFQVFQFVISAPPKILDELLKTNCGLTFCQHCFCTTKSKKLKTHNPLHFSINKCIFKLISSLTLLILQHTIFVQVRNIQNPNFLLYPQTWLSTTFPPPVLVRVW